MTAVPFTPVRPCGKQRSIGALDQMILGFVACQGDGMSKLIAIVDNNELMKDSLSDLIESGGFETQCFGSVKAFLESDLHRRAAFLIIDIHPKMSGLELQATLKQEEYNVPIIFIAAFDDAEMRAQGMKEGAVEVLSKPFDHGRLLKILRCTLDSETYGVGSPGFAIGS